MTLSARRNALRKSAISVDTIRKSVSGLSVGLVNIGKQSRELLKQTRESNIFKSSLVRKDGEFFRKRRENILRKQREDELESSSVTGVAKKQGNLIQKSTRGFLGRMIDFLGVLLLGWALTNLPMIIAKFMLLFKLISRVVGILGGFLGNIKNVLVGIGSGVSDFLERFNRFEFGENSKKIREKLDETNSGFLKLNKDFLESVSAFANDENIKKAAEKGNKLDEKKEGQEEQGGDDFDSLKTNPNIEVVPLMGDDDEEDLIIEEGDEIPEDVEAAAFTPITQEDIDREILLDQETETETEEEVDVGSPDDSVVGVPNDDKPLSVTPVKPSEPLPSAPTSSSSDMNLEPEEGYANIEGMFDPVGTTNKMITPVKRKMKNLKGRKKPKSTVVIVEKGVPNMQSAMPTGGGGNNIVIPNTRRDSQKTLLDLQRLNLKNN